MQGQIYKIYSDSYYVKSDDKIHVCKIREVIKKLFYQERVISSVLR